MIDYKATRNNANQFLKKHLLSYCLQSGIVPSDLNKELKETDVVHPLYLIYQAFNQVPDKYLPLLKMLYFDGLKIKEAMSELKISHDTTWKYRMYGLTCFAVALNEIQEQENIDQEHRLNLVRDASQINAHKKPCSIL